MKNITPKDIEVKAVRAGLRMNAVCALAGVSQATFSRWKKDEKKRPGKDFIDKLWAVLNKNNEAAE